MKKIILFIFSFWWFSNANAQIYTTDNGYAEFKADATMHDYKGKSNQLTGRINLDNRQVHFELPVKSISTDNDNRDSDMYDLMKVSKYPDIVFDGKIQEPLNLNEQEQKVTVKGKMTIRGVTKTITVNGTIKNGSDKLKMEASWNLYLSDYNIDQPSFLFFDVDDKHEIYIKATLSKEEEVKTNENK